MELKNYQKHVMDDLSAYLTHLDRDNDIFAAWKGYWMDKDIAVGLGGVPDYRSAIPGVPRVCAKVPTGGGKTFMACAALRRIFDAMPLDKPKVVVWLVPSDSILTQTIRNLSNPEHEYRLRLNSDFAGRVGVYTKEMLLNGQQFSPETVREMLTVCVLSYGSLRIDSRKKDVRKVYQENGELLKFAPYFQNIQDRAVLLSGTPDTALIQVLRHLSPVVVVDESHNAGSDLSVEMLNNLNPSFVLDLTATPRENSNILSYVDARELKKENMVKLPVVVYNRTSYQSVVQDAIQLRGSIEQQAIQEEQTGGAYIRPIVLFQAQPKTSEDSETFDKIKTMLISMGIPKEEIAVKTSKTDELGKTDLMSRDCPIRYIITVNALKEGWDCPFAYILASLANKTSKVDVEQILGRILRQPYARQHRFPLLNTSYVFTCSQNFHATLDEIVKGLHMAGFSKKDFRVAEAPDPVSAVPPNEPEQTAPEITIPDDGADDADDFDNICPDEVRTALEQGADNLHIEAMVRDAEQQAEDYNHEMEDNANSGFAGGELGDMLNQIAIQPQFAEEAAALRVPQFCVKGITNLYGGEYELLEKENLSDGFSLSGQDAQISFELAAGEMYRVDLKEDGEAIPQYKRVSKEESEYLRELLARLPPEKKIQHCVTQLCKEINKNNRYAAREIREYVRRVVENMTEDELAAMETAIPVYGRKIQEKIDGLENIYRREQFKKRLDSGKVVCRAFYAFPQVITPAKTIDSIPYSLYEAEKADMNTEERNLIDIIVGQGNIKWWHRIIVGRTGFRLNGNINHYPDFMVMTKAGKLVLVEFKGDDRDNSNSKMKLELGRQWQYQAGPEYRYFMVFQNNNFGIDGAYTLDQFVEIMREL